MSERATEWAWATAAPTATAKLVLLALARKHDPETGDCWPTREWLASTTGAGERTVHDALNALEVAGLITRFSRSHPVSRGRLDDGVVLQMDPPAKLARNRGAAPPQELRGGRVSSSPNAANGAGEPVARSPSFHRQSRTTRARLDADASSKKGKDNSSAESPSAARDAAARRIWEAMGEGPRRLWRTGAGGIASCLRDIEDDPGDVAAGVEAFYASNPDSDRSPAGLILDGEWRGAVRDVSDAERDYAARWDASRWDMPPHHPIGTDLDPGPARQWSWLDEHFRRDAETRDLFWPRPARGAPPGHPDSRVWPSLLDDYRTVNAIVRTD